MTDMNDDIEINDDDEINEIDEIDENIKNEIEIIIKNGIEWFNFIIKKQDDYYITIEECEEIFKVASSDNMEIMFEGIQKLIDGVVFCCSIFNKIKEIKSFHELKQVIKFVFVDNEDSEHLTTEFIFVQALTKINIHLILNLCYIYHPRLRRTPEEAIDDIIYPIECSQKIMRDIINEFKEIKNK